MTTELRPGVWHIPCFIASAYLLETEDGPVLVDAGSPLDARRIRSGVRRAGYELGDIRRVLVTHFDVDHVGALNRLTPDLDADVYMGPADAKTWVGEETPPESGKGWFHRLSRQLVRPPALPITRVTDGSRVGDCHVLATPGHTPGHTVYTCPEREVAFFGDLVVNVRGTLRPAPWFLNNDTGRLRRSIREFVSRTPHYAVAAMGHGEPIVTGGEAAMERLATSLL